ncbi:MAG: TIR domain-containing protein [Anaerolineaceae bacterium]|nr:TIR domain-containing protein [Anaerolineaceae bacterium]MCB9100961.1 TIR domain-containing protein [Anaerolineales bacterium]
MINPADKNNPIDNLRILVIDDDPIYRELIGIAIEKLGHTWHSVTNPMEALQALEIAEDNKEPFSVVTIDLDFGPSAQQNKQTGGIEIFPIIKRRYPDMACIIISGASGINPQDILTLRDAYGLGHYISKDRLDPETLDLGIKKAFEQVRTQHNTHTSEAIKPNSLPLTEAEEKRRPSVFISYSHKDEVEKEEIMSHLGVLAYDGLVDVWVDDQIEAGQDWLEDIEQAIRQARVAILLITKNFLNSKFIRDNEVPRLLERRKNEGLIIIPVIARPCAWQRVEWLTNMNVKPKNGAPVWRDGGSHVDDELADIAEVVADILDRA